MAASPPDDEPLDETERWLRDQVDALTTSSVDRDQGWASLENEHALGPVVEPLDETERWLRDEVDALTTSSVVVAEGWARLEASRAQALSGDVRAARAPGPALRVVAGGKQEAVTRQPKGTPTTATRPRWTGWVRSGAPFALLAVAAMTLLWLRNPASDSDPDHNTASKPPPRLSCPPFAGPEEPPETLGTEEERGRIFQLRRLMTDGPWDAREDIAAVQARDDPSVLSDEREALAVHVDLCLDKAPKTEARARGEAFLKRYPKSPWAEAIGRELRSPPELFPYRPGPVP